MKKTLYLFSMLFAIGLCYAQSGLSAGENYIYTKNCLNEDCSRKTQAVQYSDGMGRIKQEIGIESSPGGKDIVTPVEYDGFGRQVRSYLPIPQAGTQGGAIYADPKTGAPQTYGSDPYFYSESILEQSPSARLLSTVKPGTDYHSHSVTYGYGLNAADEVRKYTITTAWLNGATDNAVALSGNYGAGELTKTSVTDEDGHTTIRFSNGKSQTVLVKKENTETFYLYNKYGQLVYVIPPLAAAKPLNQETLDHLCYQYRYDSRGRQVEKKLPGKGWEYMVYDRQDRVLMTQDANMGTSKLWMFSKYDRWGRVVYTGTYTSPYGYGSQGRQFLQQQADTVGGTRYESRSQGGFAATGITAYYTNTAFPTAFTRILSIQYYDTYPVGSPARPQQVFGNNTIGDNMGDAVNTKNLPTASLVKNLEDDLWTKTYVWYDNKARAVSTHSINHLGGFTTTESLLDFAGVVQQSRVTHSVLASGTPKIIKQDFEYDAQNRLKKQWHQVNGQPQELLSENTYNELSQLTGKKVGNNLQSIDYAYNFRGALTKVNDPASIGTDLFAYSLSYYSPAGTAIGTYSGNVAEISWKTSQDNLLKKYTYRYDALNRLTSGTYAEPDTSVPENGLYNESAAYDPGGNIISLQRNGRGFSATSALIDNLSYTYTGNRLATVKDNSQNYMGYPEASGNAIIYDDNGNMESHADKGILEIRYNLLNLPDYVRFNKTYVPRFAVEGGDFNVNTQYLYRADGTRLRKTYTFGSAKTNQETALITEYFDGFQYEATDTGAKHTFQLKFVPTSEGYYDFEKNRYIYSYTDYLGNVRLNYFRNASGSAEVLDKNDFYPFGMRHDQNVAPGNSSYLYQYGGKELQKETGWNDFGARMYMSDIGRWGVIDPLAETTTRINPYNYALDNPVMFVDPDGRKAMAPDTYEALQPMGGALGFMTGGGSAVFGSFEQFLGQHNPLRIIREKQSNSGGGSGINNTTATNIIINFLRGDKDNLGSFVNSDFEANGWHVIDASSLADALMKLTKYLGNNQADNIYINAHGFFSKRYVLDENGQTIPDSKSDTGFEMTWDTGFHTDKDEILGTNLQQYISDKSKLSSGKQSSIESFIGIANYVKEGKNLIIGSCYSANDAFFGTGLSSLVKSRDVFVNRDFSSNYVVKEKGVIPFNNFINYNQTSQKEYKHGWVWYRDGSAIQTNFNIIMTKYGVKTIK